MDAIAVFDRKEVRRSFGKEYPRGGHGIDTRKEATKSFSTSATCSTNRRQDDPEGEHVWIQMGSEEPGVYSDKAKYSPTNVAFGADGGFYIGDGYGSNYIHQYDKEAKWVRTWGGFATRRAK